MQYLMGRWIEAQHHSRTGQLPRQLTDMMHQQLMPTVYGIEIANRYHTPLATRRCSVLPTPTPHFHKVILQHTATLTSTLAEFPRYNQGDLGKIGEKWFGCDPSDFGLQQIASLENEERSK
jgi:hypothetical protein